MVNNPNIFLIETLPIQDLSVKRDSIQCPFTLGFPLLLLAARKKREIELFPWVRLDDCVDNDTRYAHPILTNPVFVP